MTWREMQAKRPVPPIERVLDSLEQAGCQWSASTTQHDSWIAQCPHHEDRAPSLLITRSYDGKILIYCRALCPTSSIIRDLGLEWVDLWEDKEKDPARAKLSVHASRRVVPPERIETLRLIQRTLHAWGETDAA